MSYQASPAPGSQAPYVGYGYPPGPGGCPPPRRRSKTVLIVFIVIALAGLGIGAFFGVRALMSDEEGGGPRPEGAGAAEGSGEIFSPPGKPYSVEIPTGVVKVPLREDESIPSETDLSLELEGKVQTGGLIKTGTLAGPAADGTFDEVGEEAARGYTEQYEGDRERWGAGAQVDETITKLDGQNAIKIAAKFSPSGNPEPSTFFRVYFIEAPSGPPILITCDWNATVTPDIEGACDTLVASFTIKH